MNEYDIYFKYSDWQAGANCLVLIRRREKKASYLDLRYLHEVQEFYSKYLGRRTQAQNVDSDQKLAEHHICSKYSDSQVRANSVYPDRTPLEYPI